MSNEKVIHTENIFDGRVVHLRVETIELPNGQIYKREIVRHNGAVAIVPIDNDGNEATFTISATVTIAGFFITTDNTKGGTSGTLVSAVDFTSSQSAADDDVLEVEITFSAADS